MKLFLCIALLFAFAYAAVHLAPEPREPELMNVEQITPGTMPPLEVPDFALPDPPTDCDNYNTDFWVERRRIQRCSGRI